MGLSSLWQWVLVEKLVKTNLLREIKVTRPSAPVINPISHEEWAKLVRVCEASHNWKTREETKTHRVTFDRDRAFLFTLLDTGARATKRSEVAERRNERPRYRIGGGIFVIHKTQRNTKKQVLIAEN